MAREIRAMPSAVRLRADYSAEALRALARRSKDANQSRRLLSLAAVRDGMDRGGAAKIGGMDRQTLRDWVHRFNAAGPEGLIDNWTAGPEPRLSAEQLAEFAQIVEAGPDREKDGIARWRRIDRKRVIAEKFGVDFHPLCREAVEDARLLHMSARPRHPAQDERIVEAFKNVWPAPSARGLSRMAADPVCFNVSGLEELPPAMMEIRTLRSS
jgi:transposase